MIFSLSGATRSLVEARAITPWSVGGSLVGNGNTLGNAYDMYQESHSALNKKLNIEDENKGGVLDALIGFLDGLVFQETFGEVGDSNKMNDWGKMLGATASSLVPLFAGTIGLACPPLGTALLAMHGLSSATSGCRALGDALMHGETEEFMNAFMYFTGSHSSLKGIAKTGFAKNILGLQQSHAQVSNLNRGVAGALSEHVKGTDIAPQVLLAELLEQGKKHPKWDQLKGLDVDLPKTSLSAAMGDHQLKTETVSSLENFMNKQNRAKLKVQLGGAELTSHELYTALKTQGEQHPLWKQVAKLEVKQPPIKFDEALRQREIALKKRTEYLQALKRQSNEAYAKSVQAAGAGYERTAQEFVRGRQRVANTVNIVLPQGARTLART